MLVLWHGYLLRGTGSNIYTQHVARAWGRLGHDVRVLCQEPQPERFALGPNVRVVRPDVGPLLPTFVLDRYEGIEARLVGRHVATPSSSATSTGTRGAGRRAARAAAPTWCWRTTRSWAARWPQRGLRGRRDAATPSRCTAPSWSTRSAAARGWPTWPRPARRGARALFAGSRHIVDVTEELLGRRPVHDRIAHRPARGRHRRVPPGRRRSRPVAAASCCGRTGPGAPPGAAPGRRRRRPARAGRAVRPLLRQAAAPEGRAPAARRVAAAGAAAPGHCRWWWSASAPTGPWLESHGRPSG